MHSGGIISLVSWVSSHFPGRDTQEVVTETTTIDKMGKAAEIIRELHLAKQKPQA